MLQQFSQDQNNGGYDRDMNSRAKKTDEWNKLTNIQSQQVNEYEQQQRELQKLRQDKYREELQHELASKDDVKQIQREEDKRVLEMQMEQFKKQDGAMYSKQQALKMANEQSLNYNKQQIEFKQQQEQQKKILDHQFQQSHLLQAQESLEREKQLQYQKKFSTIQELNSAFRNQQDVKQEEQHKLKEKDLTYAVTEKQMLEEQEKRRVEFMNRIKGGFSTKDYMVDYYKGIYDQKQQKEFEFQQNNVQAMQTKQQREIEAEQQKRQVKDNLLKQNHDILEMQINQKEQNKRYQQEQQQLLYQQMQNNLKLTDNQMMQKQQAQQSQKQQYISELRNQIDGNRDRKLNERTMNEYEQKINQGQLKQSNQGNNAYVPIVPGLAPNQDVHRQKQLQYVDKSLGVQGNLSSIGSPQKDEKKRSSSTRIYAANQSLNNVPSNNFENNVSGISQQQQYQQQLENPEQQQYYNQGKQDNNSVGRAPSNKLYNSSLGNPGQQNNEMILREQEKQRQADLIAQATKMNSNIGRGPSNALYGSTTGAHAIGNGQQQQQQLQQPKQQGFNIISNNDHNNNNAPNVGNAPSNKLYNSSLGNQGQQSQNSEMVLREQEKQRQADLIAQATKMNSNVGRGPSNALYGSTTGAHAIGNGNGQPQQQQPQQQQYNSNNDYSNNAPNVGNAPSNKLYNSSLGNQGQQSQNNEMLIREQEKQRQADLIAQATKMNSNVGRGPSNALYGSTTGAHSIGNGNGQQQQQQTELQQQYQQAQQQQQNNNNIGSNVGRAPSNKFQGGHQGLIGGNDRKFEDSYADSKKQQEELLKQFHAQNQGGANIGRGPSNKWQGSQAQGSVF